MSLPFSLAVRHDQHPDKTSLFVLLLLVRCCCCCACNTRRVFELELAALEAGFADKVSNKESATVADGQIECHGATRNDSRAAAAGDIAQRPTEKASEMPRDLFPMARHAVVLPPLQRQSGAAV